MSRQYVNGLKNFVIEGGLVSFTLTDQRSDGAGRPVGAPEPVVDVMMRVQDLAQMTQYLSEALAQFRQHAGAPAAPRKPAAKAPQTKPAAAKEDRPPLGGRLKPGS